MRVLPYTLFLLLGVGCAGPHEAAVRSVPTLELPEHADPSEALEPLEFLVGRWIAVNPNGTVNEEVWTPPRGNAQVGTFRQVRLDGDCAFVEISQIAVEEGELVLRLRHLHGRLEVPANRPEVSEFRLVSLAQDRVEFTGTGDAAEVASVVYERTGPGELVQSIGFGPDSKEKPFVTRYSVDPN